LKDYLSFTVIAAIVTTFGTLLGLFLKDFIFVYYFDKLKEKRSLEKISKKYKDPILLSAAELLRRMVDYNTNYETLAKSSSVDTLFDKADRMVSNYAEDTYFLKYKLTSTLYRFCSFFGWLELYRQEITFLDSHSKSKNSEFLLIISKIREAIADGQLNDNEDWESWHDTLIFREELRSVGEGMIEINKEAKSVSGYGKFQHLIKNYETTKEPMWLNPVIVFFTDLKFEKDFRVERFALLKNALIELIKCLNKEYYLKHVKSY
jgi:hypothetical protein